MHVNRIYTPGPAVQGFSSTLRSPLPVALEYRRCGVHESLSLLCKLSVYPSRTHTPSKSVKCYAATISMADLGLTRSSSSLGGSQQGEQHCRMLVDTIRTLTRPGQRVQCCALISTVRCNVDRVSYTKGTSRLLLLATAIFYMHAQPTPVGPNGRWAHTVSL